MNWMKPATSSTVRSWQGSAFSIGYGGPDRHDRWLARPRVTPARGVSELIGKCRFRDALLWEVVGSRSADTIGSTRGCGSVGRASPCQGEGRRFDPGHPLHLDKSPAQAGDLDPESRLGARIPTARTKACSGAVRTESIDAVQLRALVGHHPQIRSDRQQDSAVKRLERLLVVSQWWPMRGSLNTQGLSASRDATPGHSWVLRPSTGRVQ
jgi:hypothetical protein